MFLNGNPIGTHFLNGQKLTFRSRTRIPDHPGRIPDQRDWGVTLQLITTKQQDLLQRADVQGIGSRVKPAIQGNRSFQPFDEACFIGNIFDKTTPLQFFKKVHSSS